MLSVTGWLPEARRPWYKRSAHMLVLINLFTSLLDLLEGSLLSI